MWHVDPASMAIISKHIRGAAAQFFPNLQHLSTEWVTNEACDDIKEAVGHIVICVPFLAGPRLRSFVLARSPCDIARDWERYDCTELVEAGPVLVLLAEQCPNIERLVLRSSASDAYAFLSRLTRLEEIIDAPVATHLEGERRLIAHLAAQSGPGLRILSLTDQDALTGFGEARLSPLKLADPVFPSLEYLLLSQFDSNRIMSVLDELRGAPKLRHFSARLICGTSADTSDALFAAVSGFTPLESLALEWDLAWDWPAAHTMTSKLAHHLHTLRNLRVLSLSGFTSVSLTDADLADLAAACPCLEDLQCHRETISSWKGPEPAVTLMGLAAMRNACPRLRRINVGVGSLLGPGVSRCIARHPRTLRPLELTVPCGSPALKIKPEAAALILRALFPLLTGLACAPWRNDYWHVLSEVLHAQMCFLENEPYDHKIDLRLGQI